MTINVCLAGATGWAGSELARGIATTDDVHLASAVARSRAGQSLANALGAPQLDVPIYRTAAEALAHRCDVFVEYTRADAAAANIRTALEHDLHVVVGSSGLTDDDFAALDTLARQRQRAVLACGNFALTMVLLQKFAAMAAKYLPSWEIIDYAYEAKPDAPSGTARELANRLASVRRPDVTMTADKTLGLREARGAELAGTQVHSVRLPGFVLGIETIFGLPDQTLILRHQAGTSAKPYVDGALLAIRKVAALPSGVHRGLDAVLEL